MWAQGQPQYKSVLSRRHMHHRELSGSRSETLIMNYFGFSHFPHPPESRGFASSSENYLGHLRLLSSSAAGGAN